jgi:hypothetical protein
MTKKVLIQKLVKLLKQREFVIENLNFGSDHFGDLMCRSCGWYEKEGHSPECELAQVLKEAEKDL